MSDDTPNMLPMLDLQHLQAAPEAERKALARSAAGAVIHEAGHFLAAAKLGLPVDFLMFNWAAAEPQRIHVAYVHERYGRTGRMRPDLAGRLRLLAAGYAAEMHVFGVGLLNRATSDLEAVAEAQGIAGFELERDGRDVALSLYGEHDPFRPGDAAVLVDLHNTLAQFINAEGGPDDIFVIPNYRIPRRFRRLVPFWRRLRSAHESRSHAYTFAVRDRVLDGVARSGV